MTPFTRRESEGRRKCRKNATSPGNNDGTTNRWLIDLHRNINPDMKIYYEWPIWVEKAVISGELKMTFDDHQISPNKTQDVGD